MALYESVFIVRQDLGGTQVEALADQFTEVITQGGGQVTKRELWGLRNLAYRIKKNRKGHYVLFNIDAPAETVQEYRRQIGLSEDILRDLTVRVEDLQEGPSAVLQNRGKERERGGRGDRERGDRGDRDRGDRGDRDRGDRGDRPGRDRDRGERMDRGPREDRPPRDYAGE